MNYLTKEAYERDRYAAFLHAGRQYLIRCANSVIHLAPLPEFVSAIRALGEYDARPSQENRENLKRINKEVFSKVQRRKRNYGYTAAGLIHLGLQLALNAALHPKASIHSGYAFYYTEACFVAGARKDKFGAQNAQSEKQAGIQDECFRTYYAEFGKPWKEYRATILAAEGAL